MSRSETHIQIKRNLHDGTSGVFDPMPPYQSKISSGELPKIL
ncbi:MAG: hypothetical protein ACMUHY_03570 [Thermoplasmatota archaeon]